MKRILYLLVFATIVTGCYNKTAVPVIDSVFIKPHSISKIFTEKTIAVFGDSISFIWPSKFAELSHRNIDNFSIGGASYTFPRLNSEAPSIEEQIAKADMTKYDMIFISSGTNDWFLGQTEIRNPGKTKREFKKNIERIYSNLKTNFHGRIIIIIPLHFINKDNKMMSNSHLVPMNFYRNTIYGEAKKYGFDIINSALFKEFPPTYDFELSSKFRNLNGEDPLHPSYPAGTDCLAERIYGVLTEIK